MAWERWLPAGFRAMPPRKQPHGVSAGLRRVSAGEFPRGAAAFKEKFPHIDVQIFAEPIGDMLAKTAVAMASKSDRYDVIFDVTTVRRSSSPKACSESGAYLDKSGVQEESPRTSPRERA